MSLTSFSRSSDFYPRPPRGGRPASDAGPPSVSMNFYPRPPRGGRLTKITGATAYNYFYPRPPRGGRPRTSRHCSATAYFYPRPPRGGRHMVKHNVPNCAWKDFYPRPPRGGRHIANGVLKAFKRFLSTPSARRATRGRDPGIQLPAISIHALREEGDSSVRISSTSPSDFYPRPPRGGRL